MDCLSNISTAELLALSNSLALYFFKNYSLADITKLIGFFVTLSDNLALLAIDKIDENPNL